jgi:hypothetical protein
MTRPSKSFLRLACWSFAVAIPVTVAIWLLSSSWENDVLAHPELVDQVTVVSRIVGTLQTLYFPALVATIVLSGNPHQPSEVVAGLAMVSQTFAMTFLGAAAAVRIRREIAKVGWFRGR